MTFLTTTLNLICRGCVKLKLGRLKQAGSPFAETGETPVLLLFLKNQGIASGEKGR